MPRWTYITLTKSVKEYPCTLRTTSDDYSGTSKIEWDCECGSLLSSSYKELVRWKGQCKDCRKTEYKPIGGKSLTYTHIKVKEIFEDADCLLLTDEKHYQGPRQTLDWKCKCGEYQRSSFNSFNTSKRCKHCSWKSNGGVSYQTFCELLEKYKWEMIGDEKEYKNTKTVMKVRSDMGGITETSYNRFQQGHRSKEEIDDSHRNEYKMVKKAFRDKGFKLLEDKYVNKSTLMRYKCRCGEEAEMSYDNLKKNIIGCIKCCDSQKTGNSLCQWETNGRFHMNALLADKIKKYEFPSGRKVDIQGYENICLDELLDEGIDEEDIVVGFDNVPSIQYLWKKHYHTYYPDIYIESENRLIEVKSDFTISYQPEKNESKWISTSKEGYLMDVYVYINKKKAELRTYQPYETVPTIEKFDYHKRKPRTQKSKTVKINTITNDIDEDTQTTEIEDWPGCMVTSDGRVFGNHKKEYTKMLADGVVKVQLHKKVDGKWKRHRRSVDYLVIKHFSSPKQSRKVDDFRYIICHKNKDPCDNRLINLELKRKEDVLKVKSMSDNVGKGVMQFSVDGELIKEYKSTLRASQKTGISIDNIKQVCRGSRKRAGGFVWKYKEIIKPEPMIDISNWRAIPKFPTYKISRSGDIWSFSSNDIIKPYEEDEVLKIKLTKDKKQSTQSIHLLVARTYLPEPDLVNMSIRHKNMNKLDNRLGNLEWVPKKGNNRPCKAVTQYSLDGIQLSKYDSLKDAHKASGANPDAITMVCNGKRKTSGGYKWKWS